LKNSERALEIDMPLTELILTENVPGLGAEADQSPHKVKSAEEGRKKGEKNDTE
jgi:hypothetical protein